ncbi:hypothetical protein B0H17DRAFT_1133894 [Mycena rosella]|uniref:Uncharacterized protein n=1 Tax=Mycena rosella TaxID=1033263 RepID=A0AAD7DGF0_MYCRO|nr:hypothetical protein B0H17DRAFT_1133894 [Mycena rosella]
MTIVERVPSNLRAILMVDELAQCTFRALQGRMEEVQTDQIRRTVVETSTRSKKLCGLSLATCATAIPLQLLGTASHRLVEICVSASKSSPSFGLFSSIERANEVPGLRRVNIGTLRFGVRTRSEKMALARTPDPEPRVQFGSVQSDFIPTLNLVVPRHIRESQSGQKGPAIRTMMMPIHVQLSGA